MKGRTQKMPTNLHPEHVVVVCSCTKACLLIFHSVQFIYHWQRNVEFMVKEIMA